MFMCVCVKHANTYTCRGQKGMGWGITCTYTTIHLLDPPLLLIRFESQAVKRLMVSMSDAKLVQDNHAVQCNVLVKACNTLI